MRSRYTAYTRGDLVYLKKTSESPSGFDAAAAKKWANQAEWKTLKILSTEAGAAEDDVAPMFYPAAIGVWRSTLPSWAVMTAVRGAEPSV